MKFKKMLGAIAAAALASGTAHAAPVTIGGVTWNTSAAQNFFATSNLYEQIATIAGQQIRGYGRIQEINLEAVNCLLCELTYAFSGYTLQNSLTGVRQENFAFSGGTLNVYVSPINFNANNPATAADGTLWLSLAARAGNFTGLPGANANTTLYGSLTTASTVGARIAGEGSGYFDVTGGLARDEFDKNTQVGGSDFLYTSSFLPLARAINSGGIRYTHGGNNQISQPNEVPEPGALALLGLGLAALGVARRNKKQA